MTLPPADPNPEHPSSERPYLHDDTRFAAPKIAIFQYATVVLFLFLISGFWRLQVANPDYYKERAEENRIKSMPILAPRGRILDRDGRVIVDNHASFTLILTRENLKEEHLKPIAEGLDLDLGDLQEIVRRYRTRPKYEFIRLKEEMTPADLAFVDSHRDFFPELEISEAQHRMYPQNGMMAHLLGYTGAISLQELDTAEFAKYKPGDVIGKFGVERQYNDTLMGIDGQRQVEVDNRGQVRHVYATPTPSVPGKDLRLTIDLDLQAVAELAMDGKNGAVVAMDPRSGEILAMVSRPTFDPNKFSAHISARDLKELTDNPDKPFFNRAIQAAQAPGSTFKPIMALAALETGTIDENFTVHCPGGANFYGRYYRCHLKTGHGAVALHKGIVQSCDTYFYTVGNKMGIDDIAQYADMVGYGHATGIDLPHEAQGVVPSPAWAIHTQGRKWYAGDTISVSIGQGALTVTPLQMARAISGLAMGGVWHRPRVVKEQPDKPTEWPLNPQYVKDVVDGMYGVVNEGGTGGRAWLPNIEVCGKTGTAQVASADFVKAAGGGRDLRDNAWFVGFAPRNAPEILVVALFEHGAEGPLAAPIVRDVMTAYFDKKARMVALRQQGAAVAAGEAAVRTLGLPGPGRSN
ncbi:MAG: penicillin-binding protein 2 [Terracidiphilus sp.]